MAESCPICRARPVAVTDHDHRTGHARGRLCAECNSGLGLVGDNDPAAYIRAASYLGGLPSVLAARQESKVQVPTYQRGVDTRRATRMNKGWDPQQGVASPLLLSPRDSVWWLLDGQHRWAAAPEGFEFQATWVTGLTEQEEARLYVGLNTTQTRLRPIDRLHAEAVAGDTIAREAERFVLAHPTLAVDALAKAFKTNRQVAQGLSEWADNQEGTRVANIVYAAARVATPASVDLVIRWVSTHSAQDIRAGAGLGTGNPDGRLYRLMRVVCS